MAIIIVTIVKHLDNYLERTGRPSIAPVEANEILAKAGLLRDDKQRKGKPLRVLLRNGHLPHAFQSGGKGSGWTIPHSGKYKPKLITKVGPKYEPKRGKQVTNTSFSTTDNSLFEKGINERKEI